MNDLINRLRIFLSDDLLFLFIVTALILIAGIIISYFLTFIINKIITPFLRRFKSNFDDSILSTFRKTILRLLITGGFYVATKYFEHGLSLPSSDSSGTLVEKYPYLAKIIIITDALLYVAVVIILMLFIFRLITFSFDFYVRRHNLQDNRDLTGSLIPMLNNVSKVIIAGFATVVVLSKFDVNISGFLVSLGVGSLAVALAAKDILSNIFSGLIIMIDKPFRVGDRIRFSDNEIGDVVAIGMRSTRILDFDNNIVIIPNDEIVRSRIVNLTYPNNLVRVFIDIGLAYGSNINKIKSILLEVANKNPLVSQERPPEVFFIDFADSSIVFRIVTRTEDYKNAWQLRCELREEIYKRLNEERIEIPFPQRVVHIKKEN